MGACFYWIPSISCPSSCSGSVIRLLPEFLDPSSAVWNRLQSWDLSPSCPQPCSQTCQPSWGHLQSRDLSPSRPRSCSRSHQPSRGRLQSQDPSPSRTWSRSRTRLQSRDPSPSHPRSRSQTPSSPGSIGSPGSSPL